MTVRNIHVFIKTETSERTCTFSETLLLISHGIRRVLIKRIFTLNHLARLIFNFLKNKLNEVYFDFVYIFYMQSNMYHLLFIKKKQTTDKMNLNSHSVLILLRNHFKLSILPNYLHILYKFKY